MSYSGLKPVTQDGYLGPAAKTFKSIKPSQLIKAPERLIFECPWLFSGLCRSSSSFQLLKNQNQMIDRFLLQIKILELIAFFCVVWYRNSTPGRT